MVRSAGKPDISELALDDEEGRSDGLTLLQGGATIQQSRTKFTSALKVQKERSIDAVLKKTLVEAGLAGESFFYAWTVKDKNSNTGESVIEGIGIKGSMILVRNWGNCTITVDVSAETTTHWTLSAGFVDFETGFNIERLFRQRKGQEGGRYGDSERKLDINFQIGQSKAVRNIIVNALPSWIQDQCLETAKETAAGKYKDVANHIPKFLREFAKFEVTKAQLELKVGLPVEQWEPRDLVMLAAIGRAIKDRQTSVENEFPRVAPEPVAQATVPAVATVTDAEFTDEAKAATTAGPTVTTAAPAATEPEPAKAEPAASANAQPAAQPDQGAPPVAATAAAPAPAAGPATSSGISSAEAAEIAAQEAAENAAPEPPARPRRNREPGSQG
jgi:hypothetical protein